ncbi:glycosyltransferase family 4 protein [Corynebacterium comes]|uniref:GDP-mannose-dependent alpha-(1-6)-phosphatidylinositol monomannoside mannosyltransferase n=1 Tax=Corynebacterium comes TaxID=2675218 RepID=A0A6B8VNS2_9CORY|nr:glycosyltransferase family 4 protein [Corynebacterium comes]QGU05703.1 GDP-mannose-dependent alpha-(1-6)-phosphatidylinositol monomannoside mannosyltransferase [Corynebacterium comes]
MHILAVNAGAEVSGAERVLAELLKTAVADGHRVTLLCPPGALPESFGAGIVHVPVPLHRLGGERGVRRLRAVASLPRDWWRTARRVRRAARGAEAVIVNSTFALPAIGLAFPLHSLRPDRRPRVSWLVHDTIHSRKQRTALRLGAHALTVAVAVSQVTADSIRARVRRTVVRPNGVVVPEEMSGGTARVPGRPVAGILAVLTEWKGQDVLLEALAQLPDVQLDIAGTAFPGSEEFERLLRARAAQPDLAGRVHFLGHVDKRDVLPRWDVLVSASTSPEAGPLGVLEAMAHGVPVVATDHGGAAEYLRGGAGILVPPEDAPALAEAIRTLLDDPVLARELRDTARCAVLARHDAKTTVPAMLEALSRG